MGKIFSLTDVTGNFSINLKCDPEKAIELRASYPTVQPGYHMNKKHWITVNVDGSIDNTDLKEWIDHSYDCVVQGLTKRQREELQNL
jgi:predicted DNA-binding protein (MmcQ/YjbR family)